MFKPLDRMYIEALATKQDQSMSRVSIQNNSYGDLMPTIPQKNSQMTTQGSLPEHNTGRNHVAYFGGNNRSVSSGSKKNQNYTLQDLEKIVTNSQKKKKIAGNTQKQSRSSSVKRPQAPGKINPQATLSPGIPRVSRSRSRQNSALKAGTVGNARSHTSEGLRKPLVSHSSSNSRPPSVVKSAHSKSRGASLTKKGNPTATFSPGTTRQSRGATISSTIQNPFSQSNNPKALATMNRSSTSRGVLNNGNNESLSLSKTQSSNSINGAGASLQKKKQIKNIQNNKKSNQRLARLEKVSYITLINVSQMYQDLSQMEQKNKMQHHQ